MKGTHRTTETREEEHVRKFFEERDKNNQPGYASIFVLMGWADWEIERQLLEEKEGDKDHGSEKGRKGKRKR